MQDSTDAAQTSFSTIESLEPRQLLASTFSSVQLPTGSYPDKVITGLDGSVYVYEQNLNNPAQFALARKRPGSTTYTQIAIPGAIGDSHFGMVLSKKGDVYFTVHNGIGAYSPKFNRVTIVPLSFSPSDLAPGPDGNLWFTMPDANSVGSMSLAKNGQFVINPTITTYEVPIFKNHGTIAGAASITNGPKGDLWFAEDLAGQIGQITFSKGTPTITEYAIPTSNSHPIGITTGPDGNIWFAEVFGDKIGTINEKTKAIKEYAVPTANAEPFWLSSGPGKVLYFTERTGAKIGRVTTAGAVTESTTVPGGANAYLNGITKLGKSLIFTDSGTDTVVTYTP